MPSDEEHSRIVQADVVYDYVDIITDLVVVRSRDDGVKQDDDFKNEARKQSTDIIHKQQVLELGFRIDLINIKKSDVNGSNAVFWKSDSQSRHYGHLYHVVFNSDTFATLPTTSWKNPPWGGRPPCSAPSRDNEI